MHRRLAVAAVLGAFGVMGCSGSSDTTGGGGGTGGSGGGSGGGAQGGFDLVVLDSTAVDPVGLAMAVDPVTERVGVAYFTNRGTQTHSGTPDYDIRYIEYLHGVTTGPQTLTTVQRLEGLALTFVPGSGDPVVAYLGGPTDLNTSIFWFQNDAVVNRRTGASTWTETIVAQNSADVSSGDCNNPVSVSGFLVGLWPALGWDSTGALTLAYRDCHQGQFPMQDWAGSDVKAWSGSSPASLSTGACVKAGGNDKGGWGGHLTMAQGPAGELAIAYDQMKTGADIEGQNVIFQRHTAGGWGPQAALLNVTNTQTGASLAYDPVEGYGVAVEDAQTNQLSYVHTLTLADGGVGKWTSLDPVYGTGTGGWYPSLAMDPIYHEPAIAFYVCSPVSGVNDTQCPTASNELQVTQRVGGNWQATTVDPEGGYLPQLAFFASGKKVIAYRQPLAKDSTSGKPVPDAGVLKLAVER
jgi:hypothetical protein